MFLGGELEFFEKGFTMTRILFLMAFIFSFVPSFAFGQMKDREKTDLIVIHHSETTGGSVEAFRRYHVETNKWADIGYHYVITNGNGGPDGMLHKGRSIEKVGAHAPGRNDRSVAICLVGTDKFTDKQKETLIDTIIVVCNHYKIFPSERTIQGHHEKCPGDGCDLGAVIKEAQRRMTPEKKEKE
ncbi:MAG: hypothetical protein RJA61_305 [Candidatus Parcubacteria bacterium]|jgi:hypothetical protein